MPWEGPLVFAGCGGSPTSAPAKSSTAPAASNSPILVGSVTCLTGPLSSLGTENRKGEELAVAAINKAGGIDGHTLKLVLLDDQSNPSQAVADANQLIGEHAAVIIGSALTDSNDAMLPVLTRAGITLIEPAVPDSTSTVQPYLFDVMPGPAQAEGIEAQYIAKHGWKRVAVLHDTVAFAVDSYQALQKALASTGAQIVHVETYNTNDTNMQPQLTKIAASHPDVLVTFGVGPAPVIITKEYRAMKASFPLMFGLGEESYLYTKPAGSAANGVLVASPLVVLSQNQLPQSVPASVRKTIADFKAAYRATYHTTPTEFAGTAYTAVEVAAHAMRTGGIAPSGIEKALSHMSFPGVDGVLQYSGQTHDGLTSQDMVVMQVQNGNLVPVSQ